MLMPFKADLDELYTSVLRPSAERSRLSCARADDIYGPKPIMADIWRSIRGASVIIADLTNRNPNVFYELGLSHAIQKPVVLIAQDIGDVPFDLRHLRIIIYRNTEDGRQRLATELSRTLRHVTGEIKSKRFSEHYVVLDTDDRPSSLEKRDTVKLLRELSSEFPDKVIGALSKVVEQSDSGTADRKTDPRVLARLAKLLNEPLLEIQEAAIHALAKVGSQLNGIHLHRFLESDNPGLVRAACDALGTLHDESAVGALTAAYAHPRYRMCRENILRSLGEIGGVDSAQFLLTVATSPDSQYEMKWRAVTSLGSVGGDCACRLLARVDISLLECDCRCDLASALAEISSPDRKSLRKLVGQQVDRLMNDDDSEVRGAGLAAYFAHSLDFSESGWLDRNVFWTRLSQETADSVESCLDALIGRFDQPFQEFEVPHLLNLASKGEIVRKRLVYALRDIGDASACELMLAAYRAFKDERLWILDFFSRVPFKPAESMLRESMDSGEEPSYACLAAIGLGRIGVQDVIQYLVDHANEVYGWVKVKIRQFLLGQVEKEKNQQRRRKMKEVLKKLPKKW